MVVHIYVPGSHEVLLNLSCAGTEDNSTANKKKQLPQVDLNADNKLYGYINYAITITMYVTWVKCRPVYSLVLVTYVALILWMLYYKNIHSHRKGVNLVRTTSVKLLITEITMPHRKVLLAYARVTHNSLKYTFSRVVLICYRTWYVLLLYLCGSQPGFTLPEKTIYHYAFLTPVNVPRLHTYYNIFPKDTLCGH